jgi:hypothetical protein
MSHYASALQGLSGWGLSFDLHLGGFFRVCLECLSGPSVDVYRHVYLSACCDAGAPRFCWFYFDFILLSIFPFSLYVTMPRNQAFRVFRQSN